MRILNEFLALIFTSNCHGCREPLVSGEDLICTACRVQLPYLRLHEESASRNNIVIKRFWGKVPVKHALAYLQFVREGRVQNLLHQLKYRGTSEIGEVLGKWFGNDLAASGYRKEFDLIVPVPLHRKKQQKRGYNQSACFASGLAAALHLPWTDKVLVRKINSGTQTNKNRPERWNNVASAFVVAHAGPIQGKRVLLVDDVLTTGSTLEACARILLEAGCSEVSVATIAAA